MTVRYVLAAMAVTVLISTPAFARPAQTDEDAPRQATVSYADLNLNTEKGQAILAARIHRAAETVCGPEPDSRDLERFIPFQRCMKQTVDTAVAAIPSASHLAGSGKPAG
jgi:UrcA family protein